MGDNLLEINSYSIQKYVCGPYCKRELERIGDNLLEINSHSIQKNFCGLYYKMLTKKNMR